MTQYHNPQQEPGSERRLLIVFALTFLVLMVFQPLLSRYLRQQQPAQSAQKAQVTPPAPTAQPPAASTATAPGPPSSAAAPVASSKTAALPPAALRQAKGEVETVVDNGLYRITFSNRGGQVKSWILKKHLDDQGHPLNLVHEAAAQQFGYPLSLWTYDPKLRTRLNTVLYVPNVTGEQKAPSDITFEYADEHLQVTQDFPLQRFLCRRHRYPGEQDGQSVSAYPGMARGFGDQRHLRRTTRRLAWSGSTATTYSASRPRRKRGQYAHRSVRVGRSRRSVLRGRLSPQRSLDGECDYPAQRAWRSPESPRTRNRSRSGWSCWEWPRALPAAPTSERLFVGPKALDVLQSVKVAAIAGETQPPDLSKVLDFGKWLGWIAYPLFLWLRWTYHHMVSNWGWAIVVLTVIINLVLFPLRLSSMKSAMKMQKLQPQMNSIKEKYKKYAMRDPRRQEMNQEMAELFKREGANPAGGCLPLMLQMPFLIAFYSMLANANELRNASFLWIRDLSSPDPYYIIPILIIATTFAMQKMTPQAGMDPTQQRVMTVMMPVMLGVISWTLSAGLGVYWILGNMIGIGQQQFLNRTRFGKEMRAMAEKRARQKSMKPSKV